MHAYRLVDTITYRATSFLLVELPDLGGQYLLPARKVKRFKKEGQAAIEIPEKILSQIKIGLRRPVYRIRLFEQREKACMVSVDVGDGEERPCWVPRSVVSFTLQGSSKGAHYMRVSRHFEAEFVRRLEHTSF